MRTLLVETDALAAANLLKTFRTHGVVADVADTAEEALELARHYDYDLIVSELSLDGFDGVEMLRRLRVARISTPVMILSEPSRPEARIRAFSAGADDVLQKPFDVPELIARMQAILRRSKGFSDSKLSIGNLTLHQDSREVRVDQVEVKLTGKEYAILELLVLRRGTVLTKDAFLNHLYGGMDEPEAKIIDVFICKLRKKLSVAGADNVIGTVWGRGYMLRDPNTSPASGIDAAGFSEVLNAA